MATGLLSRLFGRAADKEADSPELAAAIDRAVQRVEPRLRLAGGYPDRYRRSVACALNYARELAGQVPGPVDMSPEHYAKDPFVHALFSAPEEMQHALCMSHAMHEYARRPDGLTPEVYALMGMRRREKTAFGMEANGEVVSRGVAQRVVCFTDHTLSGPAPTETEARELLMWSLFDSLVDRVVERVQARRKERQALEKERDYLTAELHGAGVDAGKRRDLQQRLQDVLARLGKVNESLDLRRLAEDFDAVLLEPQAHLKLEEASLSVDGMGVVRDSGGQTQSVHALRFTDLYGRDRRRWTVVMVRCHPRPGAMSAAAMAERLQQAGRWLQI